MCSGMSWQTSETAGPRPRATRQGKHPVRIAHVPASREHGFERVPGAAPASTTEAPCAAARTWSMKSANNEGSFPRTVGRQSVR